MNPFLLSPKERLAHWSAFRRELPVLPEAEQFARVADYFAKAPLVKIAYDPVRPDTWPTPWEMISDGEWCRQSIAVGMEATLRLAGLDPERTALAMIICPEISDHRLVLQIDGRVTLNYLWGLPTDRPLGPHRVIGRWRFRGRGYADILS